MKINQVERLTNFMTPFNLSATNLVFALSGVYQILLSNMRVKKFTKYRSAPVVRKPFNCWIKTRFSSQHLSPEKEKKRKKMK